MKKILPLIIILSFLTASLCYSDALFPDRDYMTKHSIAFFKKINLTFPLISRVEFFVKSGTYNSAYIYLAQTISKDNFFKNKFTQLETSNKTLIDAFTLHKKKFTFANLSKTLEQLTCSKKNFLLVLLYTLANDFKTNQLSGNCAFQMWNAILLITENAYKEKKKSLENANALNLAAHLVFFKKAKKWQKKAKKIIKKMPPAALRGLSEGQGQAALGTPPRGRILCIPLLASGR
ncbi:MAG: hypothetical protein GY757_08245 [bacterium]|nr:hypothetical protein [bacterium]